MELFVKQTLLTIRKDANHDILLLEDIVLARHGDSMRELPPFNSYTYDNPVVMHRLRTPRIINPVVASKS